jgi:hypothetical protein
MFLRLCSPKSSKARSRRPAASSWTRAETQIPPGSGQRFEARGDVDAVAENVAVLDDDVALMDADAKFDALGGRDARGPLGHVALHCGGAAQRIDDAGELNEQAVAGGLDDAALIVGDARVDQFAPQCPQLRQRPFLIETDEPRIAGDIGGEDRRQASFGPPFGHRVLPASAVIIRSFACATTSAVIEEGR